MKTKVIYIDFKEANIQKKGDYIDLSDFSDKRSYQNISTLKRAFMGLKPHLNFNLVFKSKLLYKIIKHYAAEDLCSIVRVTKNNSLNPIGYICCFDLKKAYNKFFLID